MVLTRHAPRLAASGDGRPFLDVARGADDEDAVAGTDVEDDDVRRVDGSDNLRADERLRLVDADGQRCLRRPAPAEVELEQGLGPAGAAVRLGRGHAPDDEVELLDRL